MINYVKTRILPAKPTQLILQTFQKWQQDECSEMGAALSYYALFSLFPTFLVILSVVGFFLGPDTNAVDQILRHAQTALPPMAYRIFEDALSQLNHSSVGAGAIGFVLLLFTSSNVFGALDRFVDKIWKAYHIQQDTPSLWASLIGVVKNRLFAFALVIGTSALMIVSLLSNIVLKTLRSVLINFSQLITFIDLDAVSLLKDIQIGLTFLTLYLVIGVLFKILPSTCVRWSDIWPGSLVTTGLLVALQQLISNSIVRIGSQYQSYGLLGGVMVLMLWLYLTCQIFFIGNVFTYVYAHLYGSRRAVAPREQPVELPTATTRGLE
ncbi:MAG: YihY/virulence factor BrkB family protein [Synechococcales bacterium]|nr:YihY/virulence factor BrkB family protein [Synechococcales bacterium]